VNKSRHIYIYSNIVYSCFFLIKQYYTFIIIGKVIEQIEIGNRSTIHNSTFFAQMDNCGNCNWKMLVDVITCGELVPFSKTHSFMAFLGNYMKGS
jgi:hypothetical protein